jgi:Glyoxalase/Bleomycin resistance protein/Dioxygenase superfamily
VVERGNVINGVNKVVIEVDDQARALAFWTERLGFEVVLDTMYGDERWIEVMTPDRGLSLVLSPRQREQPSTPEMLPTSNAFFYCDDLVETYEETSRTRCRVSPTTGRAELRLVVVVRGRGREPLRASTCRGTVRTR